MRNVAVVEPVDHPSAEPIDSQVEQEGGNQDRQDGKHALAYRRGRAVGKLVNPRS